jgi:hypothetical protein
MKRSKLTSKDGLRNDVRLDEVHTSEYTIDILSITFRGAKMKGYITAKNAAEKWGITERQVQSLCKSNRIEGATRISRIWIIPENVPKPTVNPRKK